MVHFTNLEQPITALKSVIAALKVPTTVPAQGASLTPRQAGDGTATVTTSFMETLSLLSLLSIVSYAPPVHMRIVQANVTTTSLLF